MTFEKSDYRRDCYKVFDAGKFVGFVRKVEGWTVRGRPVSWKAFRGTLVLGRANTRAEAAKLLNN